MNPDSRSQTSSAKPRRQFIPGVYTYCDGWCERCRFQARCRLFRNMRRQQAAIDQGLGDAAVDAAFDDDEGEDDAPPVSAAEKAEFLAFLEEFDNRAPTAEEMRELEARMEPRRKLQDAHPLTVASREYGEIAHGVTIALRPMLEPVGDPVVLAALETIERFALLISVKTWRAVGGLVDVHSLDDDGNDEFAASDANGCAKLVRLIVAESREAWEVLMQTEHAAADGVPAAMVRRLEKLDSELAEIFPRAMEFVRAGFDTHLDDAGG